MQSPQPSTIKNIIAQAVASNSVLRWPLPPELEASQAVAYRNDFATTLAKKKVPEILRQYVYLSADEMRSLLLLAFREVLDTPLSGTGIELGAGCGLVSSIIATRSEVETVFALEVCEKMVSLVIPKVVASLLPDRESKVIPVVGSFNDIRLPDNSLDFAIEIDSLHHSDNLHETLAECARVLKPGGRLLCFDRCHPNSLSDEKIDEMLSRVYSQKFLIENSYPPDIILTRRQNGEHEYRLFEWENAFKAAGLDLLRVKKFGKPIRAKEALKGLRLAFGGRGKTRHTNTASPLGTMFEWIGQKFRLALGYRGKHSDLAVKETTVFLLRKN